MSRSSQSGGAAIATALAPDGPSSVSRRVSATAANRSAAWAARTPRSTGSDAPGASAASNRASHSMSSRSRRIRFDSVDPQEGGSVPRHIAVAGQRQARVRLDDRQRRPELVRGVGGELELASARGSIGAATRRPIATAPRNTPPRRNGAMSTTPRTIVRLRVGHASRSTGPPRRGRRRPACRRRASSVPSIVAVTRIGRRVEVGRQGRGRRVWPRPSHPAAPPRRAPAHRTDGGRSRPGSSGASGGRPSGGAGAAGNRPDAGRSARSAFAW